MKVQTMTQRQAGALAALFLLGNCLVFGVNTEGGRDTWIALLLAVAVSVPVLCVYARLLVLYPGRGFFETVEMLFGRVLGTVVTILLVLFALHSAGYLIRSVGEFVFVNVLPEPPFMLFVGAFVLAAIYLLRQGVAVAGKWALIGLVIVALFIAGNVAFSMREMDFRAFLPILRRPAGEVLRASGQIVAFPMLQSVLLLPFLERHGEGFKPRRALLGGLLAAALIMLLVIMHELTLLGEHALNNTLFPSYSASKIVSIGGFLSRLEKGISMYILVAGLTHLIVCLNAASRGLAQIFKVREPFGLLAPVGLCALALSWFVADNLVDMERFRAVLPYYAVLFELIIPLALWVCAEVRHRAGQKETSGMGADSQ